MSSHRIPPAIQKKGKSTIRKATPKRAVLSAGRLIIMELQSNRRVAASYRFIVNDH